MRAAALRRLVVLGGIVACVPDAGALGWSLVQGNGPSARSAHTMVYDQARARVVLFGGGDATGLFLNDVWEFDGVAWAPGLSAPGAMQPRRDHAMAYDELRSVTIVFGGQDQGYAALGDTWEFTGSAWSPAAPPPAGLTPRRGMAMAFDPVRGRTVMYGGRNGSAPFFRETWEYDAAGWIVGPAAPAGLDGRVGHAMAYDPARAGVALLAGYGDASALHDDLWLYDGTGWVMVYGPNTIGLYPRTTAMAFDGGRRALVLFGGNGSGVILGDTWSLGTSGAKLLDPDPAPGIRFDHAMATLPDGSVLLFGGQYQGVPLPDSWILGPVPPTGDYLVGAGGAAPNAPTLAIFDQAGGLVASATAYGAGGWGVNVGAGALTGQSLHEILTAPGPGPNYGPQIRAFSRDGVPLQKVNFYAYGTLKFGARVAAGDTDWDGEDEILTAPGPGMPFGPHIRGFDYEGGILSAIPGISFFAFGTLRWGADVAASDLDGGGAYDEILVAPGPSAQFGPQIRGFKVDGMPVRPMTDVSFMAFAAPMQYGAFVAGGDVDFDPYGEILCARGAGPNQIAQLRGFTYDGLMVALLPGFDVTAFGGVGGARVGGGELTGDERAEVLASPGADPTAPSLVTSYTYDGAALTKGVQFTAFPTTGYGANPRGAVLGY